ncbi:hypothetical protein SAMN05216199_2431 [Pedococcus cremeus]|uniref:Uncharacterized protein n=1 Tax=Pedococcus cremeus TaxID=587636 RepID=A0A1H9VLQ0_9MICO|nr:hypothetical protein [Pedococcus cremeus]SES22666.1 hypothetical protein SAMN05216199_2431 [Pedococcus cremeus]
MAPDPIVGADLTDGALQDEIELVGDLVVAASASEGPLSEDEIDEVLGVDRGMGVAKGAKSPQHV